MAVRTDVTVNWNRSPRIITVAAPSSTITIQDLVDTLRELEHDLDTGVQYDQIISAAGKEDLGGGVNVGVTATLLNAKLAFEGRTTTGTATAGSTGLTLVDSSADFINQGVGAGDTVVNTADGSEGFVLSVDSATQLTIQSLNGGTENDVDVGETYEVFVETTVTGGNLVAVDANQASINPVSPTPYTFTTVAQSTSASIIEGTNSSSSALWPHIVFR